MVKKKSTTKHKYVHKPASWNTIKHFYKTELIPKVMKKKEKKTKSKLSKLFSKTKEKIQITKEKTKKVIKKKNDSVATEDKKRV